MPSRLKWVSGVLAVALATSGCIGPLRREHVDLRKLMEAYEAQSARADSVAGVAQAALIDSIDVIGEWNAPGQTVTLDVTRAPLALVVARILAEAGHPHIYEVPALRGVTTARIIGTPLIEALNLLLGQHGYSAILEQGIIRIRQGVMSPVAAQQAAQQQSEIVAAEIRVSNLDDAAVTQLVNTLLQGSVKHVFQAGTGIVFLTGPGSVVREALALIARADRAPTHVLIEALVVEFDREALRELGIDFSKAQIGNFQDILFDPGNVANLLKFKRVYGQDFPKQYEAVVQALAVNDRARIIARPYVSTRSGEEARVDIAQERHFIAPAFSASGIVTSLNTLNISTGVKLSIRPVALPGDQVRVTLSVEESQFIPAPAEVTAAIDKNLVSTTMQVNSRETIVIGGLALNRDVHVNAGIPILRNIPLLNLLFAKQTRTERQQEVVIFITPYIWDPSMNTPMPLPRAFTPKADDKTIRP